MMARGGGLAASDRSVLTMTVRLGAERAGSDGSEGDGMAQRSDVVSLDEVGRRQVGLVGGKGAQLGELMALDGVRVPPGACVTTDAYRHVVADAPAVEAAIARLAALDPDDLDGMGPASAHVRRSIEQVAVPSDLVAAVSAAVDDLGADVACAVRSSATVEDRPSASFAGQHDSYLNVIGASAVVGHVRRCWASLFTERAVAYRAAHGIDHRDVAMAVVVQRMASPRAAGVLFTADPVTSDRTTSSVEAVRGLGDALVSGRMAPDRFCVRDGEIVERAIALDPSSRGAPSVTDAEVVALAALGRRIEAHLGSPQDVEWCLVDDDVEIVQSRPITTLFPVPETSDGARHVYVSVGHQQMMTDAMTPLGLSVWQLTTPRPMAEAGGRLFVDVTPLLGEDASRAALLDLMGRSDPLLRDALETVVERGDLVPARPDDGPAPPPLPTVPSSPVEPDPTLVTAIVEANRASVEALRRTLAAATGPARIDAVLADVPEMRRVLTAPESRRLIMAAMDATWWLNDHVLEWLGERNAADRLSQAVPGNVTSEMGLALLDVADAIRPHPEVVALLRRAHDDGFLDEMTTLPGGREAGAALAAFLAAHGMRCVGEIDVARPRWADHPVALVPAILADVDRFAPGEAERRVARGRRDAERAERDLLARLRELPDGEAKAAEAKQAIDRVRTFVGYREYPKYGMISRYHLYRQALWAEADRLVAAGRLGDEDDIAFLRIQELREVAHGRPVDQDLVEARRAAFAAHQRLVPPRVLTSDGEVLSGAHRRGDLPPGALAGLGVSVGVVEGRARVVLDVAQADLGPEDVLVTSCTDPSWSPLFVGIRGLVTEVGGLMTHGAVVAREYGLPAVVGVDDATRRIVDGQRIRIDGSDGTVEILSDQDEVGGPSASKR